jgi:hypothetical protein
MFSSDIDYHNSSLTVVGSGLLVWTILHNPDFKLKEGPLRGTEWAPLGGLWLAKSSPMSLSYMKRWLASPYGGPSFSLKWEPGSPKTKLRSCILPALDEFGLLH